MASIVGPIHRAVFLWHRSDSLHCNTSWWIQTSQNVSVRKTCPVPVWQIEHMFLKLHVQRSSFRGQPSKNPVNPHSSLSYMFSVRDKDHWWSKTTHRGIKKKKTCGKIKQIPKTVGRLKESTGQFYWKIPTITLMHLSYPVKQVDKLKHIVGQNLKLAQSWYEKKNFLQI